MANLKKLFPEFYQDNLDKKHLTGQSDNLIVLDTNYILEVIKSPTIVSKQYVEAIEKVQNNIYIPYLVALEFNFNKSKRKKMKIREIDNYKNAINNNIVKLKGKIADINFINSDNKSAFTKDIISLTEQYSENIQSLIDKNVKSMVTNEQEELYNRLISVIENKIGEQYTQEWIQEIEKEGITRFEKKIPPGFNDEKKEDPEDPLSEESLREYGELSYHRKFGDLLIWKDIIRFSENCSKNGKKVIFVTDDGKSKNKNDLLYKVGNLTVGPNIYLMNELQREAKKELYIVNNLRFIQLVNNLSDEQVNELKSNISNQYGRVRRKHHTNMLNSNKMFEYIINESDLDINLKTNLIERINDGSLSEKQIYSIYKVLKNRQLDIKSEYDTEEDDDRLGDLYDRYFERERAIEEGKCFEELEKERLVAKRKMTEAERWRYLRRNERNHDIGNIERRKDIEQKYLEQKEDDLYSSEWRNKFKKEDDTTI